MKKLRIKILAFLITLAVIGIGVLIGVSKLARWFDSNTLRVQLPISVEKRGMFVIEKRKPLVQTAFVKEPTCEWSKVCVEKYIDFVAKGDKKFAEWAKFTANWEGGYRSQYEQVNATDSHSNGELGSYGQFQFGKGTYDDHCEPNSNWKMDWKAQTRCAKTIWDKGMAHNTWWNTTNKYLSEKGINKLSMKGN